jgi:hypothetical protein
MEDRYFIRINEVVPFINASIGAHIANLYNKGHEEFGYTFWARHGKPVDCRLHLLMVGGSGFGKTFFIDEYLDSDTGLIYNTIPTHWILKITHKHVAGGYTDRGVFEGGIAYTYRTAIIGCEEYSAVLKASDKEHSKELEEQMLQILDKGRVNYGVGTHDPIEYDTYITLIAGTQSERIEAFITKSGMSRRFVMLDLSVTLKIIQEYKDSYDKATGIRPDYNKIDAIRNELKILKKNFSPRDIIFTDEYKTWRRKNFDVLHTEWSILDRIALGWTVVNTYRGEDIIYIYPEPKLKDILTRAVKMRLITLFGSTDAQILKLVDESKEWQLAKLKKQLLQLGIEYKKTEHLLDDLVRRQLLKYETRRVDWSKRKVIFVTKGEAFEDYGKI